MTNVLRATFLDHKFKLQKKYKQMKKIKNKKSEDYFNHLRATLFQF